MELHPNHRFISAQHGTVAVRSSAIDLLAVTFRAPDAWTVAALLSSGDSWDLTPPFPCQADALDALSTILRSIQRIEA